MSDDKNAPAAPAQPNAAAVDTEKDVSIYKEDGEKPPVEAAAPVEKPVDGEKPAEPKETVKPGEITLKAPDGSKLSQAHIDRVAADAKAKGMTQEQAQAMLERDHNLISEIYGEQETQFKNQIDQWKSEAASDEEVGGADHAHKVEIAHRALKQFADDDLIDELERTGLGNHPKLVRMLYRIGKANSEDKLIASSQRGGSSKKSAEEIFYPNQT